MAFDPMVSYTPPSAPPPDHLSLSPSAGWRAEFRLLDRRCGDQGSGVAVDNGIVLAHIPLLALFSRDEDARRAFDRLGEGGDGARVALADHAARALPELLPNAISPDGRVTIRTMAQASRSGSSADAGGKIRRRRGGKEAAVPFVLERTDCSVVQGEAGAALQLFLHAAVPASLDGRRLRDALEESLDPVLEGLTARLTSRNCYARAACVVLQRQLRAMLQPPQRSKSLNVNVSVDGGELHSEDKKFEVSITGNQSSNGENDSSSTANIQRKYLDAVSFIADGSLLPRRSGRSLLPMPSPPAVPFSSPDSEQLTRVVTVDLGPFWRRYLNEDGTAKTADDIVQTGSGPMETDDPDVTSNSPPPTTVTMRGMIVPCGVTLIVGGGYHGKSTLLQAINMGVYDAIPGDGRERAVTHADAVAVRAEDGRYVNSCNVSAFISNLPSGSSVNGASVASKQDTSRFSTKDASGSTSQAANVTEALESGASALLVDEDVSAANFMARDGRMRAMIMDEPITPLLYRVNGLFLSKRHGVSTVVVVGGVGEWLDVADAVVLMKDYVARDGLAKARSVSYQFSYGHVQYAGKGVVHRLPWEVEDAEEKVIGVSPPHAPGGGGGDGPANEEDGRPKTLSPLRRRPDPNCVSRKFENATLHLPEGGSSCLRFYLDDDDRAPESSWMISETERNETVDEDDGMVDMSKCLQLLTGNAAGQLYGCGVSILWLLKESRLRPDDHLPDLLDRLGREVNGRGMNVLLASLQQHQTNTFIRVKPDTVALSELFSSRHVLDLWEAVGHACRPRRHEVAMALNRIRGMTFEILPDRPGVKHGALSEEEARRRDEESRRRALADLWANRRKR